MLGDVKIYANKVWDVGYGSGKPSISGETYESSGGETSGIVYDIADAKRGSVVTIDSSVQSTSIAVDISSASSITVDTMIIDNHNLSTADAEHVGSTFTVDSSHSGVLGTALSEDTVIGGNIEFDSDGISILKYSADYTSISHKIELEPLSTIYSADITIGEMYVCKEMAFSVAPDQPTFIRNYDGVEVATSFGGQKYGVERYGERKAWSIVFPVLTETDIDNFEEVVRLTRGNKRPFYIDLGESSTPHLYFVRFLQNSIQWRKLNTNAYSLSFDIESEV